MAQGSAPILTTPYNIEEFARAFRKRYASSVGHSLVAEKLDAARLGINTRVIQKSIEYLGFRKLDESKASDTCDDSKLNLLVLSSQDKLAANGAQYLVQKPFVSRMHLMCSKWYMVLSLRAGEQKLQAARQLFVTGSGRPFTHEQFVPYTLNLNNSRLEEVLAKRPGKYLAKESRGSMGEKMHLVDIRQGSVREDLLNFLKASEYKSLSRSQVILQQYVDTLLVDKRKFDLRVYLLVVNARRQEQSACFAFVHPGFVRLCTAPYDPLNPDLVVHLTNQSVQAKFATSIYRQVKEATTWYPDELNEYFNKRKLGLPRDWVKETLYPRVGALMGYAVTMFKRQLDDSSCSSNTFRVLGVDLLVCSDLQVYLLEFNEYPAWGRQTSALASIKPNLWREAICLTSEAVIRYKRGEAIADGEMVTGQNWRLVYSSENPQLARDSVARYY